jgi:hypothetical protein
MDNEDKIQEMRNEDITKDYVIITVMMWWFLGI